MFKTKTMRLQRILAPAYNFRLGEGGDILTVLLW